jgi:hypothetical protein
MFQLIYLRFTQPRADPTVFAAIASQARALLANRMASPDVVFNQAIAAALSRNSPRRQPETRATVDEWDLAKSLAFYQARFAVDPPSGPPGEQDTDPPIKPAHELLGEVLLEIGRPADAVKQFAIGSTACPIVPGSSSARPGPPSRSTIRPRRSCATGSC